ncbi:MAG: hypothetical protein HC837_06670 [Chloroflexaceae bacterium]|nr:hypothetical protein [Chloroflexaceae bacterium]
MTHLSWRPLLLAIFLLANVLVLNTCGNAGGELYVQDVINNAAQYANQEITVNGAYVWLPAQPDRPSISVLALGYSTLDSGLDAQPLGDPIWVDGFPPEVTESLHRPGDSVYGFVRVTGQFEANGNYGPDGQYQYRLNIANAEPIEQIQYTEHTISDEPLPEGQVSLVELSTNPDAYNGQVITTRGYYFWNSIIWVLAEGIAVEEGGSSPQPISRDDRQPIWLEGFPPEESTRLNVGPNNSYVWGLVEVTGTFQTGGGFGKDGAYEHMIFAESARSLVQPQE